MCVCGDLANIICIVWLMLACKVSSCNKGRTADESQWNIRPHVCQQFSAQGPCCLWLVGSVICLYCYIYLFVWICLLLFSSIVLVMTMRLMLTVSMLFCLGKWLLHPSVVHSVAVNLPWCCLATSLLVFLSFLFRLHHSEGLLLVNSQFPSWICDRTMNHVF